MASSELQQGLTDLLQKTEALIDLLNASIEDAGRLQDEVSHDTKLMVHMASESVLVANGLLDLIQRDLQTKLNRPKPRETAPEGLTAPTQDHPAAPNERLALLSKQFDVPSIDLDAVTDIPPKTLGMLTIEVVRRHRAIPLEIGKGLEHDTLTVAMSNPHDIFAIDDLKFFTGHKVEVRVALQEAIDRAIERFYTEPFKRMTGELPDDL